MGLFGGTGGGVALGAIGGLMILGSFAPPHLVPGVVAGGENVWFFGGMIAGGLGITAMLEPDSQKPKTKK